MAERKRLPGDEKFTDQWGYLPHSKITIKRFITECLQLFDENATTNVSLLCITKSEPLRYCCESDIYKTDDFSKLFDLAENLYHTDPTRNSMHSHPKAHRQMLEGRKYDSYRNAIKRICETRHIKEKNETFVFGPTETESFSIYIIFTVEHDLLNKYFHLSKNIINQISVNKSLLYAFIRLIGHEICAKKIYDDDPIHLQVDVAHLLERAAKLFISRIGLFNEYYAGEKLYETINIISSMKYEKKESPANIIFTPRDNTSVNIKILFETPTKLNNFRKTRKLLELTNKDNFLISDGYYIYGIGRIADDYNCNDESLFIVNILGHYTWELICNDNFLFKSAYNKIFIKKSSLDRNKLYDSIKRIFSIDNNSTLNNYFEIIFKAVNDKHGAILVFSSKAEDEAERLKNDEIKVSPFDSTFGNISLLTKIDGAVLMDSNCKCYAFGVILDGLSSEDSDIARGARLNSSLRYYLKERDDTELMIVVISDDETIDIIPSLAPLISKDFLQKQVDNVLKLDESERISTSEFHKLYGKISKMRFYLNADMCAALNPIIEKANIKKKKEIDGQCAIYIPYDYFEVDPNMNDSFYAENNYPAREGTVSKFTI